MQVTINGVRYAVGAVLNAAFPDIPIADKPQTEQADSPYFVVRLLESTHKHELGRRFRREHPFVVQYFAPGHSMDDKYAVAERLTCSLYQIEIDGRPATSSGMRFEIVDEVLNFYVTYQILVWAPSPEDPVMHSLKSVGGVKP